MTVAQLTCKSCLQEKQLTDFYKDKSYTSGYRSKCKKCMTASTRERYHTLKEKGELTLSETINGIDRNEYFREYSSKWRRDNPDKIKKYYRRKRDSGKVSQYNHSRKARLKQLENTLTLEEWSSTLQEFGHACAYCGSKSKLTKDHVIPVAKGGGYTKRNIIPACPSCNYSKKDSELFQWFSSKPYFSFERALYIYRFANI